MIAADHGGSDKEIKEMEEVLSANGTNGVELQATENICDIFTNIIGEDTLQRFMRVFADDIVTALDDQKYRTNWWHKWGSTEINLPYKYGFPAAHYCTGSHAMNPKQINALKRAGRRALHNRDANLQDKDFTLYEASLQGQSGQGTSYIQNL
jgi:hypothetical protein